jgi:hypothetical protein
VFDRNATGTFAPFNGMVLAGIYDVPSNSGEAIMTLWEWESGIGNSGVAPPMREESQMNTAAAATTTRYKDYIT